MVAFFVLAIGLVQVLGRMIEHTAGSGSFADEPPDPNRPVKKRGTLRLTTCVVDGSHGIVERSRVWVRRATRMSAVSSSS
jgi:hypothetical protein